MNVDGLSRTITRTMVLRSLTFWKHCNEQSLVHLLEFWLSVVRDEPNFSIRACLANKSNTNDAIVIQHSITPDDVRSGLDIF
jgi:hypothetical protein